jgi:hypothetical protein
MNELDRAILQHTNATRTLQNPSAGYEKLVGLELTLGGVRLWA